MCEEALTEIPLDISTVYKFDVNVENHILETNHGKIFVNVNDQLCKISSCEVIDQKTKKKSDFVKITENGQILA